MALATLDVLPGTWLGVGQMSHILKQLNKLFRPLCDDFQVCVLNDGFVKYDKIIRKMQKEIRIPYESKNLIDSPHLDQERIHDKQKKQEVVENLFFEDIAHLVNNWKSQFRLLRYDEQSENYVRDLKQSVASRQSQMKKFRNGCLVILPCRIGMAKVEKCYLEPIRFIFWQHYIMMGAMGGRPGQALYFVGLQGEDLIFLDPHLVQDSLQHDEYMFDEWCDFPPIDEAEEFPVSARQYRTPKI
mmetsp:Transcript_3305/g.5487  ORF Transcript_3305/g.5487 Transcript_3305/m.5487 type:complete len:243 (+) Transcript_3305:207-935(+)